jgi:hypothetical protein
MITVYLRAFLEQEQDPDIQMKDLISKGAELPHPVPVVGKPVRGGRLRRRSEHKRAVGLVEVLYNIRFATEGRREKAE